MFKKGNKCWNKGIIGYKLEKNREENNVNWKGNKAKLPAIHLWVARRKLKSELCERCHKQKTKDLANISGKYKRDIKDYKWLCRRCHMIIDKRLNKLSEYSKKNKGKSLEEKYGFKKAKEIRKKLSKASMGRKIIFTEKHRQKFREVWAKRLKNPNYIHPSTNKPNPSLKKYNKKRLGKSYEEMYGIKKARIIRQKLRDRDYSYLSK